MKRRVGIGVDVGASRVRVCVGDESGTLLWRKSTNMPFPTKVEGYVDELVSRVREGVEQVPTTADLAGIGIASVGPLDLGKGGISSPANIPYEFVPLVKPLEEAFGNRVVLMNDANAAALGERNFGAGKGQDNLVFVTISTGIGGGAIVDGRLLIGKDGNAAEIGHMIVDPSGKLICGCGRRGHWEAYCSGRNLPNLAALLGTESTTEGSRMKGKIPSDAASILKGASSGDPFASMVAREMGRLNAIGVANLVEMYDPSLITLGGGVCLNNMELILAPIKELVPTYVINRAPEIIITPLGDDAGLLGGLSLVLDDQGAHQVASHPYS